MEKIEEEEGGGEGRTVPVGILTVNLEMPILVVLCLLGLTTNSHVYTLVHS